MGIAHRPVGSSGELLDTVTVPEGAARAQVVLTAPGLAAGDTVWFGDVWVG